MKLSTPRWWYVEASGRGGLTRTLLSPLAWIWTAATRWKLRRIIPVSPGAPVICVGNLTLGGTGKTPVVRAILQALRADGVAAVGLSRGYGGRLRGPVAVDPAVHTAEEVGDEPLMLAADGAMWVARDRVTGARQAVAAGAEAIVLDDGHQNPRLEKSLSLIVVDAETRNGEWPFGDGSVFPKGPMREPLRDGLARADAVILMMPSDLQTPDARLLSLFDGLQVLLARLAPDHPPPPGPQLGFAGVGKPWKVERSLKAAGCDLVDFAPFPDHWRYTDADMRFLMARAETFDAELLTTEKDWIRLPERWRGQIAAWPVSAQFDDPATLKALLAEGLSRVRRRSS